MDILLFLDSFQSILGKELLDAKKRVADHMSQYPDHADLIILLGRVRTAYDAIACIVALECVLPGTRTRHQIFDQREYFASLVLRNERNGQWKIVEELLQVPQGLYFLLKVLNANFSPEDIFGNLVPRIRTRIRASRPASKKLLEKRRERTRQVKRPERHRGYRDQGSLRSNPSLGEFDPKRRPELIQEPVKISYPKPFQWVPENSNRGVRKGPCLSSETLEINDTGGKYNEFKSKNSS